jgi:endonuclease YncB( thermonuclease family)
MCHFWIAKIDGYKDGDTIDVRLGGRVETIRFVGVQAMELHVYNSKHAGLRRGDCHALEATARVEQLIKQSHGIVRLAAQHPSREGLGRSLRSVAVKIGGQWRDVGAIEMAEGHTLWMPSNTETAWNQTYNRLEQEAALKHIGMWNPTHCGAGPSQEVPLKLWVSSDPLGADADNVNGEFFKIVNQSTTEPIDLSGWWVRDSDLRRFTFPAGTIVGPAQTVTVYAGHGISAGLDFYWGLNVPPFQNPGDSRHLGDGGYLFDPDGDLRAYMLYPCVVACTSPDQGAVRVNAHPEKPEYVDLTNTSTHLVDLYGYAMWIPGSSYPFGQGSLLVPGQTMRLYIAGDPLRDSAFTRFWGLPGYMLRDAGGWVRLSTFDYITLGCDAWGSGRC